MGRAQVLWWNHTYDGSLDQGITSTQMTRSDEPTTSCGGTKQGKGRGPLWRVGWVS